MNIGDALISLRPQAKWAVNGNTYEGIQWFSENISKPSEDEIAQEIERLRAEHERTQYQRQRVPEYPSIGDQLDALFHAGVFPPEMAAQIQAIKDKYPKTE
jgi:hypothetical protein